MSHNAISNDERDGLKIHGIGQSATKSSGPYLVYRLTNKHNGKAYIGITCRSAEVRWQEHCQRARQGTRVRSRLYAAIVKYGPEAFHLETIATANTDDEARALEVHHIALNRSYDDGYNANRGGHGLLVVPDDIRRKIGDAQRGKVISEECKAKMSKAKLGKSECADNFGAYTGKGAASPLAKQFRFRFPDGSEHIITGLRAFARETGTSIRHLKDRGYSKGYELLERLNDQGASPYPQARGKSGHPSQGENMVFSA